MTTKMTQRDKKLLSWLGAFCVAAVVVLFVLMPLYTANEIMKEQIEGNREQIVQMEQKEAGLAAVRAEHEALQQEMRQIQENLYPILKSKDIDQLLTEKVLSHGLSARKLQITMPEEAANVSGYGRLADDGSNPDHVDGVWIAMVSLETSGTMAEMYSLIDDLSLDTPGVQVTGLSWSSDRRETDPQTGQTERYDILSLQLEVIMSRKEEQ